ncbi:MAG: hypothetical protein J07HQW2_01744 [Haloquadratum walsbyi J07HQW2]|uniref:Uncharacterized protein n=1 Tax=Haloquadratum walsbyi J07HQW2 TaxID=1238425 RepID=U1PSD8_9EURY|nr:MAG: hypothetical protein J07HQW2_01744 [Haloquadratum walsbyi J07HQW2]
MVELAVLIVLNATFDDSEKVFMSKNREFLVFVCVLYIALTS